MSGKQALTDLLAKVNVGKFNDSVAMAEEMWGTHSLEASHFSGAYRGSLDAAKALHDAVLPDQSTRIERRVGGWVVWLDNPHQGINDRPAQAWLIAILKALIAQEAE